MARTKETARKWTRLDAVPGLGLNLKPSTELAKKKKQATKHQLCA